MPYQTGTHEERVKRHFRSNDPDWDDFRRGLRSRKFQKLVLDHKKSDPKLRRYVNNYGGYLTSRETVGRVRSDDSGRTYAIRKLKNGRLACGCGDWQYRHSHRGTDCKHLKEYLGMSKLKEAAATLLPAVSQAGQAYFKNMRRFKDGTVHRAQEKFIEEDVKKRRQEKP